MGYYPGVKWAVRGPRHLEKILKRLPGEVGRIFEALVADLESEGPFPKGWRIEHLNGHWEGFLKAVLKRDYRAIYRYESNIVTIFIEKVADRKDAYGR